jgi:hypothetical protein
MQTLWKLSQDGNSAYVPTPAELRVPLVASAQAIISQATMERIQRAVIANRTTYSAPDVVAYCAYLDQVQAIATGKDVSSTSLPVKPPYPTGT